MSNQNVPNPPSYGCGLIALDVTMTILTGGIWLIVIGVRELNKHQKYKHQLAMHQENMRHERN